MFNFNPYPRRGPQFPYQQARQPFAPNTQYPQYPQLDQPPPPLQYPSFGQAQKPLPQPGFEQFQQPLMFPPTPIGTPQPPPQHSQFSQPQQQPIQGPQATTEAYVLTRATLPVAAGQPVPPQHPSYEQLVPTMFQHNGLPVYGPVQAMPQSLSRQPSRRNSPMPAPNPLQFMPQRLPVSQPPSRVNSPMPALNPVQFMPQPVPQQPSGRNSPMPVLSPVAASGAGAPQANIVQEPHRPEVIFYMLRHAHAGPTHAFQAQYTEEQYHDIGDPGLSSLGAEQCRNLRAALGNIKGAHYVLCSPMRRAMVTAGYIFPDWDRRKSNFIAWDKLRDCPPPGNRYRFTRKIGEKREKLLEWQQTIPNYKPFDLRLVGFDWHKDFAQMNSQGTRAESVRADLYKLKDIAINGGEWNGVHFDPYTGGGNVHIVILSHNNFLNFLTHRDTLPEPSQGGFNFLQCRSYTFAPPFIGTDEVARYSFSETAESQARKYPKDWRPVDYRDMENRENQKRIAEGCAVQ